METPLIILLAFLAAAALGLWLSRREAHRRIVVETLLDAAQRRHAELMGERDNAVAARLSAETALAAARQQLADAEQRMGESERLQQEMLTSTKAALLEGGTQLS